jgi:hypothetical protein
MKIVIYLTTILVVAGISFFMVQSVINNNGHLNNQITVKKYVEILKKKATSINIQKEISQTVENSKLGDNIEVSESPDTPVKNTISGGLLRQPKLILVPVWINENEYFKISQDSISVKVSKIVIGNQCRASVEIVYPDGKVQLFSKVNKGDKLFLKNRLRYLALLDVKNGNDYGEEAGIIMPSWNKAKIALYEKY